MRPLITYDIRPVLAAFVAGAAFAGCGQVVPNASGGAASSNARVTPFTSTCNTSAQQPEWIFKGACKNAEFATSSTTVTLAKYSGMSVTLKLPAIAAGTAPATLADATGKNDIAPYNGKAFPSYKGPGKVMVYLESAVHTSKAVRVPASSSLIISIAASRFPGTSCGVSSLSRTRSGMKWKGSPIEVAPKNGKLTMTIPGTALREVSPGASYLAVPCT